MPHIYTKTGDDSPFYYSERDGVAFDDATGVEIDELGCYSAPDVIGAMAGHFGLSIAPVFIPFSQSRNKGESHKSLNWRVTILHNGRAILESDYMKGAGHCPAAKAKGEPERGARDKMAAMECETGFPCGWHRSMNRPYARTTAAAIVPTLADVIGALAMDSDVIDAATFEEWAGDLGFDTDSRKAESMYRLCIASALALRAAIGDDGLTDLRAAARCQ